MIKINLAKAYKTHAALAAGEGDAGVDISQSASQAKGLVHILLIAAAPLGLWIYQGMIIPEKEALRNEKQQVLTELQTFNSKAEKAVAEIKKFKEDELVIQKRIDYLEKLNRDRLREVKVLDLLQQKIPEKVWLNSLRFDRGQVSIDGTSMSDFEISQFSSDLSKSIYFASVELLSAAEVDFRGTKVRKFELRCSMEKQQ